MSIGRVVYNLLKLSTILVDKTTNSSEGTKSRFQQFIDQSHWLYLEGEINKLYSMSGLDQKSKTIKDYIGQKEINRIKQTAERKYLNNNKNSLDYDVLTKDKFVATSMLQAFGFPCVPNMYVCKDGICYELPSFQPVSFLDLLIPGTTFYLKNTILEFNEGVFKIEVTTKGDEIVLSANGLKVSQASLTERLSKGVWVMQNKVIAHQDISKINDSALNTLRIVTIKDNQEYNYLGGFMSIGTGGSASDRWGEGAIYVGFDVNKETLYEHGYILSSEGVACAIEKHPDSGVGFNDYKIPYIKTALEICLKAHTVFSHSPIIGWDLAITDEGPLILEANETPGLMATQLICGGLRKRITALLKSK